MTTGNKREIKYKPPEQPYIPAKPAKHIIKALQAVSSGEATEHQQRIAMQWIINDASRAYAPAFYAGEDGDRNTTFALGRAFVGQQIIGLLKIDLISLTGEEND